MPAWADAAQSTFFRFKMTTCTIRILVIHTALNMHGIFRFHWSAMPQRRLQKTVNNFLVTVATKFLSINRSTKYWNLGTIIAWPAPPPQSTSSNTAAGSGDPFFAAASAGGLRRRLDGWEGSGASSAAFVFFSLGLGTAFKATLGPSESFWAPLDFFPTSFFYPLWDLYWGAQLWTYNHDAWTETFRAALLPLPQLQNQGIESQISRWFMVSI